jgi:hypothetical protein
MVEQTKKRPNSGCMLLIIGACLFVSPIVFTYLYCLPLGNPGGCGDVVFMFIPLSLLAPIVALVGIVFLFIEGARKDQAETGSQAKSKQKQDGDRICSLCSTPNAETEKRCTSCGCLLS